MHEPALENWIVLWGWMGAVLLVLYFVLAPMFRYPTCTNIGSYEEIMAAYKAGATYLDGDHDGIPCEAQRPEKL